MLPTLPPARVELELLGRHWGDVAVGPANQILVSERLRRLMIDAGLSGLPAMDEVHVERWKPRRRGIKEPPTYFLATIRRSCAVVDDLASGIDREHAPVCDECRFGGLLKRAKRIALEPGSWSGEDLFYARGLPGTMLVSDRFRDLAESNAITNCTLIPAAQYGFDHYPLEA